MDEIDETQNTNEINEIEEQAAGPETSDAVEAAPQSASTYARIKQERKKKRFITLGVQAALIILLLGGYYIYLAMRPPAKLRIAQTTAVTKPVKKIPVKGPQPGRIYIAKLGIDEAVNVSPNGTLTQEDLLKGATFYNAETNTIGLGNCVIFGHSAVSSEHGAPFGAIGDGQLKVGDEIVLTDAKNKKFTYVVKEINEIDATDFSAVKPIGENETAALTIITCIAPNYPKDKRLEVRAVIKQ